MTTHPLLDAGLTLALAYLIGSIPFGFLIARAVAGVDIRTVGSGNIGATNVGRVLGFRFFVVVFLLDFAKGYLPTRFLPGLLGLTAPDLPVGVAVAAILGHNFPVFLGFKGGKGVATSLGAVWALDWVASAAAAAGFALLIAAFRYVSVASLGGGLCWIAVHFLRVSDPWGRERIALSLASLALMGLLIVRHRANLVRLVRGTEPKVALRRGQATPAEPTTPPETRRAGQVAPSLVIGLAAVGTLAAMVAGVAVWSSRQETHVLAGPYRAEEVARVATGHQRAERLVFLDHGQFLAATCPRYDRVMLYRVTLADQLDLVADIAVGGHPVALAAGPDRVYVLSRPTGDARHVEEGWWQAFDLHGQAATPRHQVGLYPDDFALIEQGQTARLLVLTSGRGEGDARRPPAALTTYDLAVNPPTQSARVEFDHSGDDAGRVAVSPDGATAAVSIVAPKPAVVWLDLADPTAPRVVNRVAWPKESRPDAVRFDTDGSLLVTDDGAEMLWHQVRAEAKPTTRPVDGGAGDVVAIPGDGRPDYWAYSLPFDSGVAFLPTTATDDQPHDRLPLLGGRAKLSATRPMGLAVAPDRGLIAVANRSGGSVHLIRLKPVTTTR